MAKKLADRVTQAEADEIAARTQDAYSYGRYSEQGWRASCRMLARRGLTAPQIERVARSKWMRWAADWSGKEWGRVSGADLGRWLDRQRDWREEIGTNRL